jgi:calcineurin-like phosphoesterase family protein
MNEQLVQSWNATVAPDDQVFVLGDLAMGRIGDSLSVVSALAGHKTLVAGNHDRCWSGHRKGVEKWTDRYLAAGFDHILQGPIDVDLGGWSVVADHFPYKGTRRIRIATRPTGLETRVAGCSTATSMRNGVSMGARSTSE